MADLIQYQTMTEVDLNKDLLYSCTNGYLEQVRFLLTSEELEQHANVHYLSDMAFKQAVNNKRNDIVHYLIFEYKIEKTIHITSFIKKGTSLKKMFDVRNLTVKIEEILNVNESPLIQKRNKI